MKHDQHIAMAIPSLNLTCENEEVEILDGPPGSQSLGKYCEGLYLKFHSSTNCLTIKYSREPSQPPSSFDLYFYAVQAGNSSAAMSLLARSKCLQPPPSSMENQLAFS
ncbi:carbohydrate-binding protein AWN-like isoform X2 [Dipodomys merriami]